MPNQQLAEELHKPIIRKCEKRKAYSILKDNIWGAGLGDIYLMSKFNKEFCFLLCVFDVYSNYVWVDSLKDKKGITISNALQEILDESKHKPSKTWVDKGCEFHNRSMKSQ